MTEEEGFLVEFVESIPVGVPISVDLFYRYKEIIMRKSKMAITKFSKGQSLSPKGGKKGKPKPKPNGGGKGC